MGLWAALRDKGCVGPLKEHTHRSLVEEEERSAILKSPRKAQRGAHTKDTCHGRLKLFRMGENLWVQ